MTSMSARNVISWINRGDPGCTGEPVITTSDDGMLLRAKCPRCPSEYTTPKTTFASAARS